MNARTELRTGPTAWPDVTVIVPAYNNPDGLRLCIRALLDQSYPAAVEIVIVDNGGAHSLEGLKAEYPTVIFLEEERIGSYCARNTGIARARGEVFAFTDSDCCPAPDWLQSGVRRLLREGKKSIVGGRLDVVPVNPHPGIAELYDIAVSFPQEVSIPWRNYSVTANLLVRRSDFDLIGAFNGSLRSGGDGEWCRRAIRAGNRLVYEDDAIVRHPARTTDAEIVARLRRTEAGLRDISPSWGGCIREVLKCLAPPVIETYMLLWGRGKTLLWHQKTRIVIYAWQVRWLRAWLRLKFQIEDSESPRA